MLVKWVSRIESVCRVLGRHCRLRCRRQLSRAQTQLLPLLNDEPIDPRNRHCVRERVALPSLRLAKRRQPDANLRSQTSCAKQTFARAPPLTASLSRRQKTTRCTTTFCCVTTASARDNRVLFGARVARLSVLCRVRGVNRAFFALAMPVRAPASRAPGRLLESPIALVAQCVTLDASHTTILPAHVDVATLDSFLCVSALASASACGRA